MKEISIAIGAYMHHKYGKRSLEETIPFLHSIGYRCLDVNLADYKNKEDMLWQEDWQDRVEKVALLANGLGMCCYQGHTPYFPRSLLSGFKSREELEEYKEYFRRSIVAAGMLGVRWMVVHPINCPEENFEWQPTLDTNRRFWDPMVTFAKDRGVGIAFENQLPYLDRHLNFRSFCHYEELMRLIDSYADPQYVGACWDTGHAHQSGLDQYRALKALDSRLQVLHLNDNHYGNKDEHLLPWMGEVDWDSVLRALVEIGYPGTLNYETGRVGKYAYGPGQEELLRMSYSNGRYFLSRYLEEMKKQGKEA